MACIGCSSFNGSLHDQCYGQNWQEWICIMGAATGADKLSEEAKFSVKCAVAAALKKAEMTLH